MKEILNVGCGRDVRPDAENMDVYAEGPDVIRHDITDLPWPFPDKSFGVVLAIHILEHVPYIRAEDGRDIIFHIFEECYRVLKPGGILDVRVPMGGGQNAHAHIQHYRHFRPEWGFYFINGHDESWYTRARFRSYSWRLDGSRVRDYRLPYALPIGPKRLPLTTHLVDRVPLLRYLLTKPAELRMWFEK